MDRWLECKVKEIMDKWLECKVKGIMDKWLECKGKELFKVEGYKWEVGYRWEVEQIEMWLDSKG